MANTTNYNWPTPDNTALVRDGALSMRTLGSAIDTTLNKGLLTWQTYAPTLSNTWANGNGVYTATYCQIGKTVHVQMLFTLGSTTTKGASAMTFSLPVAAINSGQPLIARMVLGATGYLGFGVIAGGGAANTIAMYCTGSAGAFATQASVTATQPATWGTNDYISVQFSYQAA
jgi:hypothetical protein